MDKDIANVAIAVGSLLQSSRCEFGDNTGQLFSFSSHFIAKIYTDMY